MIYVGHSFRALHRNGAALGCAAAVCLMVSIGGCATVSEETLVLPSAEAASSFDAGADRAPTPKTLYAMARIFAAQGRDAESQFVLERVLVIDPSFMPAYCDLAELHMRYGQVDQAVRVLKVGLDISPRDPVLLNNLGMCCFFNHDWPGASEHLTEAVAISPYNTRYRTNLGLALGMMGRYEESLALYEQVVAPGKAQYNLALICEARGDADGAARARAKARELGYVPDEAPSRPQQSDK